MLPGDAADRLDRLDRPYFAVRVHDADRHRVRPNGAADVVRIHHPELVDAHAGQVEALRLEGTAGTDHRVMLDLRGDEVSLPPGPREPLHREVVGLGPA